MVAASLTSALYDWRRNAWGGVGDGDTRSGESAASLRRNGLESAAHHIDDGSSVRSDGRGIAEGYWVCRWLMRKEVDEKSRPAKVHIRQA